MCERSAWEGCVAVCWPPFLALLPCSTDLSHRLVSRPGPEGFCAWDCVKSRLSGGQEAVQGQELLAGAHR